MQATTAPGFVLAVAQKGLIGLKHGMDSMALAMLI